MQKNTLKNNKLELQGVKENNLKNIDISIDHNTFNVITGPSGSGKTSLAFDTIHAEGGRRYIETFSPYTRQFLDRLKQPELKSCTGVRASLALEQRNRITSSRSTVGTITEINDYLKIIWSESSILVCPDCKIEVKKKNAASITNEILASFKNNDFKDCVITFKVNIDKSSSESLLETLGKSGFSRIYDKEQNTVIKIEEAQNLKSSKTKEIYIAVDRFKKIPAKKRLISSVSQALNFGKGQIHFFDSNSSKIYNSGFKCSGCFEEFKNPRPSMFTFNSAIGACTNCSGFGATLETDPKRVIKDQDKSLKQGAISCWDTKSKTRLKKKLLDFCNETGIPTTVAWHKLKQKDKDVIFNGNSDKKNPYIGVNPWFERLKRKRHKMHIRVMLAKYRSEATCKVCNGSRLKTEALNYKIHNLSISDFCKLPINEAQDFAKNKIDSKLQAHKQLISRLEYLNDIGLGYLTLNRQSKTLSGGESQRVGLTSILGAELSNTTLVLDEPTIGLHSNDTQLLINSIKKLKEKNNTIIVVEHDLDVIKSADKVIDIGPKSGEAGGEIINFTAPNKLKNSETSKALKEVLEFKSKFNSKLKPKKYLKVKGLNKNNLKNIDVEIPLNCITTLVGVSGSGKSSLVSELVEKYKENKTKGDVEDIIFIDQSPIGKTPRSNAGTYTKAWDSIRELLSRTDKASKLGLSKSSFSFNVDAGRCTSCDGAGYQKVEMQFLSDVFVTCEQCNGTRFNDSIRTVKYKGKNVNDFLNMTLNEVIDFFQTEEEKFSKSILKSITPLCNLGLGYLKLGQPLSTVSGGEAQRIKIASHLKNSKDTLFILDEPTTGLHSCDIDYLVKSLKQLVTNQNSVLCIEHNLKLISKSDWIIELGPKAGKYGGEIISSCSSSKLKTDKIKAKAKHTSKIKQVAILKENKNFVSIKGAKENNLKNFDIEIPKNKINLITGVSGSGKSTLAFDILFAEGQRRYIDCLSPYARQYIKQLKHPEIDSISNLSPTIAVSQKTSPPLGVSTIATITEVYQFLRLLYSKLGTQVCPEHKVELSSYTVESIAEMLCKKYKGKRIFLFAPAVQGRKGIYNDLFLRALKAEITEAKIDGKLTSLSEDLRLTRSKLHWISLLVASITLKNKTQSKELLIPALEQCLTLGSGSIEISIGSAKEDSEILSTERSCPTCEKGFLPLDPQDFSFRSQRGMCHSCNGYGYYEDESICSDCSGKRLGPIGRNVLIENKSIHDLHLMKAGELKKFINKLKFSKNLNTVFTPIQKELSARLDMIEKIGLDYISLSRESASLSGGEAQRLRLVKSIGSPLTGVCYVLDEPSIGLHSADQEIVLNTLKELKNRGNTLVVVEHDEDTILSADNIFDFGPGGGTNGGQLVATGSPKQILKSEDSPTGKALRDKTQFKFNKSKFNAKYFKLNNAKANNLKDINVKFPLNKLTVIAGVSGAGKSSLIHQTLIPEIINDFEGNKSKEKSKKKTKLKSKPALVNLSNIDRYVEVNQKPIGKTSRSTPASYLGIFDQIRKVFANTNESKTRGLKAGYFSYNTGKGKCENCTGKGYNKIPMSFLPDATTICEVCNGDRYNEQALEITYLDKNISEILNLTFKEASEFFKNHYKIKRTVDCVLELGIGYLKLGQPSFTLSGGEAQRIKIANELGMRVAENTLYVLDEPTVGLHMSDVDKLVKVLKGLTENNNTVIVIEHNLDVIRSADYLIELGPKPGDEGGKLLFEGTPWELKSSKLKTPTKKYI